MALTETDAITAAGTSPGAGARENLAGPATSQFGYDLLGRVVSADNGHAQWDYEYDAASGGLKRSLQKFADGGAEYETSRTYTANATRLGTLNYPGGLKLSYGYDTAGRVTAVTQSRTAGSVTATGGAQEAPDAGAGQWQFAYDHAGRVSQLSAPNGTVTTYERDLDGAVLAQRTVRTADGATMLLLERGFDSRGRTQFEGASWSPEAGSEPGEAGTNSAPSIGGAEVLDVDGVGQVVRVRYGVQWTGKTGPGTGSTAAASHANRPGSPSATQGGALMLEQEFAWDAMGNRRWMVQRYAYDGEPETSITLRTQTAGLNRYSRVDLDHSFGGGGVYSTTQPTGHDRWGRVTADGGRLFDWDSEGRLRTVRRADNGTTIATYLYDAVGRRISRTVYQSNGVSVAHILRFVWDGDRVIEEWLVNPAAAPTDKGTLVVEYIWGAPAPNGLLAQRRAAAHPRALADAEANGHSDLSTLPEAENGLWTYPVLDSRGNLRAVVSGTGVGSGASAFHGGGEDGPIVLERRAITATGLPVAVRSDNGSLTGFESYESAPIPVPSLYSSTLLTGHHWDSYINWHYARHRWISPFTYGRFTSHSPLTYPVAELNYEWVFNNGWDYVDLNGLWSIWAPWTWGDATPLDHSPWDWNNPQNNQGDFWKPCNWTDGLFATLDGIIPFVDPFQYFEMYLPQSGITDVSLGIAEFSSSFLPSGILARITGKLTGGLSKVVGIKGGPKVAGARPPNMSPAGAGRRGAFREAKRTNGVTMSTHPTRIGPNLDKQGRRRPGRSYEFDIKRPDGRDRRVVIREDSGGDFYGPGNPQNRDSHFNDSLDNHFDY